MILSDHDIRAALDCGDIQISPLWTNSIQPVSVDLHLGSHVTFIDETPTGRLLHRPGEFENLTIWPGAFMLMHTVERIALGPMYAGHVDGKSSWARKGLLVHATSSLIAPGWDGQLTLEIKNVGPNRITLPAECAISQIAFMQVSSEPTKLYGSPELNSRYQFSSGPIAARD